MARIQLGLSDEDFLQETPYSLSLLMEQADLKDFKQARGTAMVAAILANVHRDSKKQPKAFTEMDFIPSHLIPASMKPKKYKQLTPIEQRKVIAATFGFSVGADGKILPKRKKLEVTKRASAGDRGGASTGPAGVPGEAAGATFQTA